VALGSGIIDTTHHTISRLTSRST